MHRFVINLTPGNNPTYAKKIEVAATSIFRSAPQTLVTETTRDYRDALLFDDFYSAREASADIRGWGGAQRVDTVLVDDDDLPTHMTRPEEDFDSISDGFGDFER